MKTSTAKFMNINTHLFEEMRLLRHTKEINLYDYNTRQHNVINREISRLNIRYNFFTNRTANSWNSLPNEIREAGNINIFKNYYDNIFI